MNFLPYNLSWLNMTLALTIGLFLIRQLLVILAAEQGRKHDLVRKLARENQEYQLSILIPFLDANEHPSLLALLHAIHEQDYPATKVSVHLVVSEETRRDLIPQSLRPNVKVWPYPTGESPRYQAALTWLIERCLAAGGNGMFVFLKPTDMIKPDYFQNIAARGLDSFAIQGYVALKNAPDTPLSKAYALSTRLFNRIGNAGRYHLGMSCRLLDSGWAIKQEVLEMIPYRRGTDMDNLEYTIRLNLENFRVNWAPNVVVYSDSHLNFLNHVSQCAGTTFNRAMLLLHYGPRLLSRVVMRFDWNDLEQSLAIITPPYLSVFLALVALTVLDAVTPWPVPGSPMLWGTSATLVLVLNILGLVVARGKVVDYTAMLFYTPLTYLMAFFASPLAIYGAIQEAVLNRPRGGSSYRMTRTTRFNEDEDYSETWLATQQDKHTLQDLMRANALEDAMGPAGQDEDDWERDFPAPQRAQRIRKSNATRSGATVDSLQAALRASEQAAVATAEPRAATRQQPSEVVRSVPLSNGAKRVNCRLKTVTSITENGRENYQLTLEYGSVSFSTSSYRILDQAYYELHAKLRSRGLTIITCGSCGNFYNPTADVPDAMHNSGVCLFDKYGKEVNLKTDAVTVVSQACNYHCPLEQRESIVREWKESLSLSRST
jgi:hypothetical protein